MLTRPLEFDPEDGRPGTAFGAPWASGAAILGGALTGVFAPVIAALSIALLVLLNGAILWMVETITGEDPTAEPERVLEEEDIIEARFVQLGRDFQDELPNREVPLLDTAPPELAQVPTEQTPDQPPEQRERVERPPQAVDDDVLRDVLNRSQIFAEIGEQRELEGSPDGIEEGTEREAAAGDVYRGRLYSFFRRGWSIPTTLNRDDVASLTVTINVQIGQDLEIVSFDIRRGSDNPIFDQSVTEQLTRLQAADQHIPPPPPEVADQYIGQAIAVRFNGRQAR